jgi:hypothetical protein
MGPAMRGGEKVRECGELAPAPSSAGTRADLAVAGPSAAASGAGTCAEERTSALERWIVRSREECSFTEKTYEFHELVKFRE